VAGNAFLEPEVKIPLTPCLVIRTGMDKTELVTVGEDCELPVSKSEPLHNPRDSFAAPSHSQSVCLSKCLCIGDEHRKNFSVFALP